jgi:penicillin-binding protein 1A
LTVLAVAVALVLLGAAAFVIQAARTLPQFDPNQLGGAQTSIVFDDRDQAVARLHATENRIQVPLQRIPASLVNAFLAIEDQDFYRHHGINLRRIAGAVIVNLTRQERAQGASTLTQQLARLSFLYPEKTYERKVKEILLAFKLEMTYSKDEILQFYLNKVYFGEGAYGVQAAAQTFFGKDVEDLSLAESAMLAGMVQSPARLSPFKNLEAARARQQVVLKNMARCGFITEEEAAAAAAQVLQLNRGSGESAPYGYFVDTVIEEADRVLRAQGVFDNPQEALYHQGLHIYTTMDSSLQRYAEQLYASGQYLPARTSPTGQVLQSAMVLLDHHDGAVKALVGGRKYELKRGFNRAVDAYRQPGSAFKPLVVYGPALEKGIMPTLVLDDAPVSFPNGDGTIWSPKNSDGRFRGPIPMRTAVQYSVNIFAVKLANIIGMKAGLDFAQRAGIDSLVLAGKANDLGLATALGGLTRGVSPWQLTSAYGAFANGGIHAAPHVITRITAADGRVLYTARPTYRRVMKPTTAWLMTDLLTSVVRAGTGTRAALPGIPCAGKTGTSEDHKNAWFVGYTPQYTCGVWLGYDQEEKMPNMYGGTVPATIWRAIMREAMKDRPAGEFTHPSGIVQVTVCGVSGLLPSPSCPQNLLVTDFVTREAAPTRTCDQLHTTYAICPESGLLATQYCPAPVRKLFLRGDTPPTDYCTIHTGPPAGQATVSICRDPRHQGTLYRANIAQPGQEGGCPPEAVEDITLDERVQLPPCPLPDHQLRDAVP